MQLFRTIVPNPPFVYTSQKASTRWIQMTYMSPYTVLRALRCREGQRQWKDPKAAASHSPQEMAELASSPPEGGRDSKIAPHTQRPARPGKSSLPPCAPALLFALRCRDLPGEMLQMDLREMGTVLNISVSLPCLFSSPIQDNAGSAEGMFVRERS